MYYYGVYRRCRHCRRCCSWCKHGFTYNGAPQNNCHPEQNIRTFKYGGPPIGWPNICITHTNIPHQRSCQQYKCAYIINGTHRTQCDNRTRHKFDQQNTITRTRDNKQHAPCPCGNPTPDIWHRLQCMSWRILYVYGSILCNPERHISSLCLFFTIKHHQIPRKFIKPNGKFITGFPRFKHDCNW